MNTTTCSDDLKRRDTFLLLGSSIFSTAGTLCCLFLFSFSACQSHTKAVHESTPAAKSETVSPPKVTRIDEQGLKDLLKPKGKPLLVNFWATWCGPCREEFPDLVKIGDNYKEKIDLVTVSLDEATDIDGEVPKFLAQMRSESPAYLLKTADQDAAIEIVSRDWQGALPFTILFNAQGEPVYSKQGKFKSDTLEAEIENLF